MDGDNQPNVGANTPGEGQEQEEDKRPRHERALTARFGAKKAAA
jgi:hypothetical protein